MIWFFFGVSLTLNIVLIVVLIIFLRFKFIDCGNVLKFFKDDSVVNKMEAKMFLDE